MRFSAGLILTVLCASSVATSGAFTGDRHVLYNRQTHPSSWLHRGPAERDQVLELNIALKQRNLDVLEEAFWKVSDPNHQHYGNFMEIDEILDLIAPPKYEHDKVVEWIKSFGVHDSDIRSFRDSISIKVPVSVAQSMFSTEFHNFNHHQGGRTVTKQLGIYSIPAELADSIDLIGGISEFPSVRKSVRSKKTPAPTTHHQKSTPTPTAVHHHKVTPAPTAPKHQKITPAPTYKPVFTDDEADVAPQTLALLYNYTGLKASSQVSQGVAEFQNDQAFSFKDLHAFWNKSRITDSKNVTEIVGEFDDTFSDGEATLDIQYVTAVGVGAVNWYWTETNWMYDFAVKFFNSKHVPDVISMSWSTNEDSQCGIEQNCTTLGVDSREYVRRVNVEFQKIGLRGVTLIGASGDSGAHGREDDDCTSKTLSPEFPASSPYITTVGATQLHKPKRLSNPPPICHNFECASGGIEVAVSVNVSMFSSGGGFSNYSVRPSYQTKAVAAYLKTAHLPPASYFNRTGRGFPDVAAIGNNYLVYQDGSASTNGGTSASAPVLAGIVSLINTARIQHGQKKLGFANPFLYQMWEEHPAAFNDIVVGENRCIDVECSQCEGYDAIKGWDPVTGLGTPNVGEIIKYVKSKATSRIA
eukprot:TRINITY_DN1239_c0_g1_i1.p1 TRINITY_DN1239_c0_g1~~TRINITY_DN1239_c0_g1_i1.p1  ORF type:complete len:640 (-),score=176.55 TRINITY_DN1239_c0_g1_i1:85-2004(-)